LEPEIPAGDIFCSVAGDLEFFRGWTGQIHVCLFDRVKIDILKESVDEAQRLTSLLAVVSAGGEGGV
jgi:hypothetical protein